jgi:hypothetical protein
MRRILVALLVTLMLVPQLEAKTSHDWENVKRQKRGTAVMLFLWNSDTVLGNIEEVGDSELRLFVRDTSGAAANWLRIVPRGKIQTITRAPQANLPNARKWMVAGAVGGGVIGLTAGAIDDGRRGTNYQWFEGGFAGAALGFLVSCAALAATGAVALTRDMSHRRIIYQDSGRAPADGNSTGRDTPATLER